ncbi:MAG TPA: beta galactosidase jelly roll domain-containing protein [Bacteroidales bacterium]
MKTKHYKLIAFTALALILGISANAEDLRKIVTLSGNWKFSIGDDSKWASPQYDDSDWDQISVPGPWENQGYKDYNGYAWYRKSFKINDIPANNTLYLIMGRIDDADVVYLNGKEIGKSGKFPPDFETAYNRTRKYIIPTGYIKEGGENVISVKVYDSYLEGGIVEGPTGIYIDEDNDLLDLKLSGNWKFQTGDNKAWKSPDFNDGEWNTIYVPSVWENQGYDDYDGYAWYRLKFTLPQNFTTGQLYLSLGKIDDIDDVYLNGEHIGNVYDLRKNFGYRNSGWEYNVRRTYKIHEGLLNRNGINTIAVRVYDDQGLGGIYEGPIGIMSAENSRRYNNKHHNDNRYNSFWDYMYNQFFRNDNYMEE